jgi:hypothetical protein
MRLFNQGKNQLGWSMGGVGFSCEPWGVVEVPDEFIESVKSRGLPLDVAPVAAELRAQVRIADEQAGAREAPLLALRQQADDAAASERAAKEELARCSSELTAARDELRRARDQIGTLEADLKRVTADKASAERLMSEHADKAAEADAGRIKAEALLAERPKVAKPKA